MRLIFPGKPPMHPRMVMRKAAYAEFIDPKSGEQSFVRRLTNGFYPRFHAYVEVKEGEWSVNLHLDQKQASYSGHTKHSGEYDGEVVEQEGARIKQAIEGMSRAFM